MRYKAAFIAGAVVGYVLGTRAGRERYEHLKKSAQRVIEHPKVQQAAVSFRIQAGELVVTAKDKAGEFTVTCKDKVSAKLAERRATAEDEDETPPAHAPVPKAPAHH
jgi:hypothetical protein